MNEKHGIIYPPCCRVGLPRHLVWKWVAYASVVGKPVDRASVKALIRGDRTDGQKCSTQLVVRTEKGVGGNNIGRENTRSA
jgi:hypothetical protein